MRGTRDRKRASVRAASPMPRDPAQSCQTMIQPATVVASAAAMKPITGISPTAKAAFTTIDTTA